MKRIFFVTAIRAGFILIVVSLVNATIGVFLWFASKYPILDTIGNANLVEGGVLLLAGFALEMSGTASVGKLGELMLHEKKWEPENYRRGFYRGLMLIIPGAVLIAEDFLFYVLAI